VQLAPGKTVERSLNPRSRPMYTSRYLFERSEVWGGLGGWPPIKLKTVSLGELALSLSEFMQPQDLALRLNHAKWRRHAHELVSVQSQRPGPWQTMPMGHTRRSKSAGFRQPPSRPPRFIQDQGWGLFPRGLCLYPAFRALFLSSWSSLRVGAGGIPPFGGASTRRLGWGGLELFARTA